MLRSVVVAVALLVAALGLAPTTFAAPPPAPAEVAPPLPEPLKVPTVWGGYAYISTTVDTILVRRADRVYQDALSGSWLIVWPPGDPAADWTHVYLDPTRTWAYFPDGRGYKIAALIIPDQPQPLPH
jgi:hypothetical protein